MACRAIMDTLMLLLALIVSSAKFFGLGPEHQTDNTIQRWQQLPQVHMDMVTSTTTPNSFHMVLTI